MTMNKISTEVLARIEDGQKIRATDGDIKVIAMDTSRIDAEVESSSLSIAVGQTTNAISVGLSIATNKINNDVQAFILNVDGVAADNDRNGVEALDGSVKIQADEMATIDASSIASSIAVAAGTAASKGFSGGGALARNLILGKANAYIEDGEVTATGIDAGEGNVVIDTAIKSTSVGVSLGAGDDIL